MYVLHQNKYFLSSLWTFVFIPTHKSSAAKFTARKELKWMILVKGLFLAKKKKKALNALRQKNVIGNLNKGSLSQQSACQNYGPTLA